MKGNWDMLLDQYSMQDDFSIIFLLIALCTLCAQTIFSQNQHEQKPWNRYMSMGLWIDNNKYQALPGLCVDNCIFFQNGTGINLGFRSSNVKSINRFGFNDMNPRIGESTLYVGACYKLVDNPFTKSILFGRIGFSDYIYSDKPSGSKALVLGNNVGYFYEPGILFSFGPKNERQFSLGISYKLFHESVPSSNNSKSLVPRFGSTRGFDGLQFTFCYGMFYNYKPKSYKRNTMGRSY